MDSFFSWVLAIVQLAGNWMVFKKMGREGWEGIIPVYNLYVLFKELYGNGWKFLLLLIPIYNIYVIIKLCIDLARAFNQDSGFAIGLIILSPIFMCILGFGDRYVYLDGSRANNTEDFVTRAADKIEDAGTNVYENVKEKYEEAGGAEGIKNDISAKAKSAAAGAKEKVNSTKTRMTDKQNPVDLLKQLGELREKGLITEEEFNEKKKDILDKI